MNAIAKPRKTAGQKFVTFIGILLCIILIPILAVNVTIIAESFISPDKVPGFMGYKPFIDLSDSMSPTIKAGDLVIVEPVDANKLVKGDIISFREGESVITHRITQVVQYSNGSRAYVTKGDNNNIEDLKTVAPSSIEGKVLMIVPKLGDGALFLQTPTGMVLFIALPLMLFIIYDVVRRKVNDRSKKSDNDNLNLEFEIEKMRLKIAELENQKEFAKRMNQK